MTKKWILVIILILNLIFVISDALRDKGVARLWEWWHWHFCKWLSFFGQQILIIYFFFKSELLEKKPKSILYLILYAILCSISWNIFYNF